MYNKSKNRLLFAIFILIILLTIFVLVLSVYNSKTNINTEEYKVSPNNVLYDEQYSYVSLKNNSVLRKEWDGKYYLYENNSSKKYELGLETVLYDKSKNQVTIYGNVFQVFQDGSTVEKNEKTVINDLSEFQFFKLSDRKYLITGKDIRNTEFYTSNYLVISIDKAGNATLLNNEVNIKTINPLVLSIDKTKFDIANEKLIFGEDEVDLKKINGSTNEYVPKEEVEEKDDLDENNNNVNPDWNYNGNYNSNSGGNSGGTSNESSTGGSKIYDEIINQIINISGVIKNNTNKTNLYKNIGLRGVNVGASYLDVSYSIIDPENKYLSVFLLLEDEENNITPYYLSKDTSRYRISGLIPNKQYSLSINYVLRGNSSTVVADSVVVLTSTDPTIVRITKIAEEKNEEIVDTLSDIRSNIVIGYKVKMYNEYEFSEAQVTLTDCNGVEIVESQMLNIQNALSTEGDNNQFVLNSNYAKNYICLNLSSVKKSDGSEITIKSYHKVKIN